MRLSILILLASSGVRSELPIQSNNPDFTPHIQTLAASCAACHGSNGNSVTGTPVLAGLDRNHFILQMQVFSSGERQATVMHRHAKGLTPEEIDQLADYFSRQPRQQAQLPPSQVLDSSNGY